MVPILAAIAFQTSLSLQVGQSWSASLETSLIDSDGENFKTDTESLDFTVLSAGGAKWSVKVSRKLIKTKIDNTDVPAASTQEPSISTVDVAPTDCFAFPAVSGGRIETRLSRLFQLVFPADGDKEWDSVQSRSGGVPEMSIHCSTEKDQDGTAYWKMSAVETKGFTAEGRAELFKNGLPKLVEWTAKKAVIPQGEDPMDVKMVFRILPAKAKG